MLNYNFIKKIAFSTLLFFSTLTGIHCSKNPDYTKTQDDVNISLEDSSSYNAKVNLYGAILHHVAFEETKNDSISIEHLKLSMSYYDKAAELFSLQGDTSTARKCRFFRDRFKTYYDSLLATAKNDYL